MESAVCMLKVCTVTVEQCALRQEITIFLSYRLEVESMPDILVFLTVTLTSQALTQQHFMVGASLPYDTPYFLIH